MLLVTYALYYLAIKLTKDMSKYLTLDQIGIAVVTPTPHYTKKYGLKYQNTL